MEIERYKMIYSTKNKKEVKKEIKKEYIVRI